jgi:RNA polymerase sigma-70 factor (ECF subfamily)
MDSIGGEPSTEVLAAIRDGDLNAFETLYLALFPSLWRLAGLRTGSSDLAKDLVQDAFFAFWRRRTTIDVNMNVQVYLAVAVRNRARNMTRDARVVRDTEYAVQQHTLPTPAMGRSISLPDTNAEHQEFQAAYHRALYLLTDREREAGLLRWEEGLTFEQIGEILGISTGGTRKIVLRAQQKLQRLLADFV